MRRSGLLGDHPYDANWDRSNFVPSRPPPVGHHPRYSYNPQQQRRRPPPPNYQRFSRTADHPPPPPPPRYRHYGFRPPRPALDPPAHFRPPLKYRPPAGPPNIMLQPTFPEAFPPPQNTHCQTKPNLMMQHYSPDYRPEEPNQDDNMAVDAYYHEEYAQYHQTPHRPAYAQVLPQRYFDDLQCNAVEEAPPYLHQRFYAQEAAPTTITPNLYNTLKTKLDLSQQFHPPVVSPPQTCQLYSSPASSPAAPSHQASSPAYSEPMQSFSDHDRDIFGTPSPSKPMLATNVSSHIPPQEVLRPSLSAGMEVARGYIPAPDSFASAYGTRSPAAPSHAMTVAVDPYRRPHHLAHSQRTSRSNSSSRDSASRSPVSRAYSHSPVVVKPQQIHLLRQTQQQHAVRKSRPSRPRTEEGLARAPMPTPGQPNPPPKPTSLGVSPVRPPPPLPVLSPVSNTTSRHHNGALMNERPPAIEKSPHLPSTSREDVRLVDASSTSFRSPQSADLSSPASETAVQESPVDITVSTVAVAVSRQADVEKTFSPILKGSATVREVVPQNNALLPTSPVHSDISEQPSVGSAPAVLSEPSYTSPRTESAYPAFPLSTSVPHSPTPASDSGLGSTNASIVDGTVEGASNMVPGMEASPQAENQPQTVELLSNSKASASKTLSNSKSLSAVRASSSICRKSSENVGSGSKAKVAAATLATEAEQQKSVLLEQQNIVHSVFRQHERLRNAQAFLQPSSPSSAQRLSREGSLEIADTSSTAWACSVRAKPRTRLNSEEGSFNSREEGLKTSIITTLEVTPRKLSSQELQDLNLMIKKQRKCEALLPNYQRKEPQRLLSIFPPKLLLDFKKLMEGLDKAEKKKTVECIGRVNMADVVNILKNDMSERDREMLQTIALYAARNHSKQENFMAYFALLIANDFDLNVRDKEGFSILAIAMRSGDLALVDLLLPYTAHTDLDPEGSSALHIAHQLWKADHRNMWDMVTLVLQNSTASLMFAKNNVYQTAISFFCGEQQLFKNDELETFLLEYGCDSIEAEGESLLHALAAARRVDLLSFCLGFFPFNPNRLDADHRTFMHRLAELSGLTRYEAELMMDMVRICGAQTTISDKKGLTAIDLATRCGNQEVVRLWNSYCKVANSFETGSFVGDISFGREVKAIKVVNEKSLASLKDFVYIRENIYLGEAPSLKGMMYCGCRAGQCSTTSCQCLKRGLAYSRSGTIVPGTCKGNPIFECGAHCACGPDCSSRVVQKGIRMAFEIFMTTKRGWGVRATRTIQPGEFIMEFVGEIIESDRLLARDPHNDWAMELTIDNYDGTMYHVDPTRCGNVARFLNHSCDPNLFPVRVYVSGDALDTGVRMAMFSAQVVGKGHELTFHYGDLYWQRQVDKGVYCACGSTKCKFQARKRKK